MGSPIGRLPLPDTLFTFTAYGESQREHLDAIAGTTRMEMHPDAAGQANAGILPTPAQGNPSWLTAIR